MKRTVSILACFGFLSMFCAGTLVAQEKATKEECVAKCKEAIALIKQVGLEAALAKIQDSKRAVCLERFLCIRTGHESKMLAHPAVPAVWSGSLRWE